MTTITIHSSCVAVKAIDAASQNHVIMYEVDVTIQFLLRCIADE
jgi:hypothetical protein